MNAIDAARIAGALCLAASAAAAAPLTVADAVRAPAVLQARLSPDGRHVAAIVGNDDTTSVLLVDTRTRTSRTLVPPRRLEVPGWRLGQYPHSLRWITDTTVAVEITFEGAVAYGLDGKRTADIGAALVGKARPHERESPLVLALDDAEAKWFASVDVSSGSRRVIRYPMPGRAVAWAFDDRGELRALSLASTAFWTERTRVGHWYRRADGEWVQIDDQALTDDIWRPLSARSDRDELVVVARHGRDTWAIFAYDPLQRRFGEVLAGHPGEDIVDVEDPNADSFASVVTRGLKPQRHWSDPAWATLQAAVDAALPARVNRIEGDPKGLVLIHSHGDVDPGSWHLLDTREMTMLRLFTARPRIDPQAMRPMDTLRYPARDGLSIPAYLTRPAAAQPGPQPMVVLVHGGPWLRDEWGWDAEVQLLASRGYVVFQPQFRGSTGFGKAFETAGRGQWGRAMQDDISDGVRHLVQRGIADPARVCIVGTSYGGYAAVWGLVQTPELYRCGATTAGVSDIGHLFSDWTDASASSPVKEIRRELIGDPERERARLDEVSPLLHAGRISAPLFIAHGDADRRVPLAHAQRLRSALDAAGRPYEWMLLAGQPHGFTDRAVHERYLNKLLDFIDRHIGTREQPAPEPAKP